MTEELKPKKIKVDGKPVTVFKAGFVHGLQRSVRIAEASKEIPEFYKKFNLTPDIERYVHGLLYPSLISCSEGSLPSEERFLTAGDREIQAWIEAAQERNSDWFSLNGSQAKKKAEKKE